ncbi:MAG: hypothetical protein K9J16_18215 [Melioribacteraceae bacterium]|nr:hypothetical protein [Melioribacteraceae bacterium]MCF8356819.1 hypothetical protein [Melioribacteraceae bacterium]MCF8396188.1 hypothetical protein [Melioribacteraceae bacterium]MCF8421142.1 hypothetical protein [Melioribacteraceae bacterium]
MDYSEDANKFFLNEENKKKKKKLEDKYDAVFSESEEGIDPEIENQFLKNIEQFEKLHENSQYVKVAEYLGNPSFKKIDDIPGENIVSEIENVLDVYAQHQVNIDILEEDDVSDRDFYIFLTEELPGKEIENIKMPGWTYNFIYEEFHPNLKLDSKNAIDDMFIDLFRREKKDRFYTYIKKSNLFIDDRKFTVEQFYDTLQNLFNEKGNVTEHKIDYLNFELGETIKTKITIHTKHLRQEGDGGSIVNESRNVLIYLKESEYGGCDIIGIEI